MVCISQRAHRRLSSSGGTGGTAIAKGGNTSSVLTPAQQLVAAWASRGMSAVLLPTTDYYTDPLNAPGTLTPAYTASGFTPISYTAQSAAGTPLLVNDGSGPNGGPYLSANGMNQTLIGSAAETVDTYIAVCRAPGQTQYYDYGGPLQNLNPGSRLGYMAAGATVFSESGPVRRNGVALSLAAGAYDLSPIASWAILTIKTGHPLTSQVLQMFAIENSFFPRLHLVAVGKWATAPTAAQITGANQDASTYTGITLAA